MYYTPESYIGLQRVGEKAWEALCDHKSRVNKRLQEIQEEKKEKEKKEKSKEKEKEKESESEKEHGQEEKTDDPIVEWTWDSSIESITRLLEEMRQLSAPKVEEKADPKSKKKKEAEESEEEKAEKQLLLSETEELTKDLEKWMEVCFLLLFCSSLSAF